MKVEWSIYASTQFEDSLRFVAVDNRRAAELLSNKIKRSIQRLQMFPRSGRVVGGIDRKDVRKIISGNYKIFYRASLGGILILAFKHSRQRIRPKDIKFFSNPGDIVKAKDIVFPDDPMRGPIM